jgi:transcriptional regulator with PAS, ATPase and Fis domain
MLGDAWPLVFQHLDDGVLVLDRDRILKFVNRRARRLLGYEDDQKVGGRCRLTTRGLDCENACPLTFALADDLTKVENFSTVYLASDGSPVPLDVTVIPLLDDRGGFSGAVEILRPAEPDPGFLLAGKSEFTGELRRRLQRVAAAGDHVVLVGDETACADVARAVHRFSGIPESLFHGWAGSWDEVPQWPPGTVFASGEGAGSVLQAEAPEGWRIVIAVNTVDDIELDGGGSCTVVELPVAADFGDDLPLVMSAWVDRIAPRTNVSPEALARFSRMARELGFTRMRNVIHAAVAVAGECLEEHHVPSDGYATELVDELLREDNPLAALEKRLLREVLERSEWRMQEAADRLGISRVTLWRKLKDHAIERPADGNET